jgi:hypothetical protein
VSDDNNLVGRAVDLFVFAPLGAGLCLKDAVPGVLDSLVARGRAEVDRRQADLSRGVTTVRSTGQFAVTFGVPKLRRRVQGLLAQTAAPARVPQPSRGPAAEVPAPSSPHATYSPTTGVSYEREAAPTSAGLPIPGYDALSASQVVERLAGLGPDELGAVQAYESAHRQRRTILGKIEQLAG